MAFNDKLNEADLQFLDDLYEFAKKSRYVDDMVFFMSQVELLIGDLDSPVEWGKYLRRIEEIYGYKDDKGGK